MAEITLKIPPELPDSMKKFMEQMERYAVLIDKINQATMNMAIDAPKPKVQAPVHHSRVVGLFRRMDQMFKKFEAVILRNIERIVVDVGPVARYFIRGLPPIADVLGDVSSVIRAARFGGAFSVFAAVAYVAYKVIKFIWNKTAQLGEILQQERRGALATGTTIGGMRAFRAGFLMLPEDPEFLRNVALARIAISGRQALILHSTLGVSAYTSQLNQMVQAMVAAQRFMQAYPRRIALLRAQEFGLTQVFSEQRLLALRDMDPTEVDKAAAWILANELHLTPSDDAQKSIIKFYQENEIMMESIKNTFGQRLAESGLVTALTHVVEGMTKLTDEIASIKLPDITALIHNVRNLTTMLNSDVRKYQEEAQKIIQDTAKQIEHWIDRIKTLIRGMTLITPAYGETAPPAPSYPPSYPGAAPYRAPPAPEVPTPRAPGPRRLGPRPPGEAPPAPRRLQPPKAPEPAPPPVLTPSPRVTPPGRAAPAPAAPSPTLPLPSIPAVPPRGRRAPVLPPVAPPSTSATPRGVPPPSTSTPAAPRGAVLPLEPYAYPEQQPGIPPGWTPQQARAPAGPLAGPTVDATELYNTLREKFANSPLNGYVPKDGARWGITTGSPDEWARLGVAVAQQESELRAAPANGAGLYQMSASDLRNHGVPGGNPNNPNDEVQGMVNQWSNYIPKAGVVSSPAHGPGSYSGYGGAGAFFGSMRDRGGGRADVDKYLGTGGFADTIQKRAGGGGIAPWPAPPTQVQQSDIDRQLGRVGGARAPAPSRTGPAPGAVTAVGGGPPSAVIIHHTGPGIRDAAGLQSVLKQRGLGVEYVVERDGTVKQIGGPGAANIMPESKYRKTPILGEGQPFLTNQNIVGMEVVAANDKDVTPAQIAAVKKFVADNYSTTPVFGHGEVNPGHKEADEGMTITTAIRADRESGTVSTTSQAATSGNKPPMYAFRGINGKFDEAAFRKYANDRGYEPVVLSTIGRGGAAEELKRENDKRGGGQFGVYGYSAGAEATDAVLANPELRSKTTSATVIAPYSGSHTSNVDSFSNANVYPDKSSGDAHPARGEGFYVGESHPAAQARANDTKPDSQDTNGPTDSGGLISPFPGRGPETFAIGPGNVYGASRSGGGRLHSGNDLHGGPDGSPVVSMNDGVVLYNGRNQGYNANIVIKGSDGVIRRYAVHGSTENLPTGTKVTQGQLIGRIGEGHVHYEEIPPMLNGKPNPVYQEFERNAATNTFTSTTQERGTVDPSGPLGTLHNIGAHTRVQAPQGQPSERTQPDFATIPERGRMRPEKPIPYLGGPFQSRPTDKNPLTHSTGPMIATGKTDPDFWTRGNQPHPKRNILGRVKVDDRSNSPDYRVKVVPGGASVEGAGTAL